MSLIIETNRLFELITNRGLVNVFTGKKATPKQECDMLNCCQICKQSFETYVKQLIFKF